MTNYEIIKAVIENKIPYDLSNEEIEAAIEAIQERGYVTDGE